MSTKAKESSKKNRGKDTWGFVPVRLVLQKHHKACGVAAISMITGIPYEQVFKDLFGTLGKCEGMFVSDIEKYIAIKKNYRLVRIPTFKDGDEIDGCREPQYDAHLLHVRVFADSPWCHFVVMDRDGDLFDPLFGVTDWDKYQTNWFEIYGVDWP